MDQNKIGTLLKTLRKEKNFSQEQLADKFYVSVRTISRWENGNTMPDISLMIELADFYDIDIRELLNGERKSDKMNTDIKETLEMVADYTNAEKEKMTKSVISLISASAAFFGLLGIITVFNHTEVSSFFDVFSVFLITLGFVYSVMGIIRLLQITGRMSKNTHKKIRIILGIVVGKGEGSNTNTYGRILANVTKTTSYFNLFSEYGSYTASGTTVSDGYKSYSGTV